MPRYSAQEVFRDGQYAYDDRLDAGEYSTYGQARGPSSNAYSDGTSHDGRTYSTSRYRQPAYDEDGYPMEGAYGGEQDLRRYISRAAMGESSQSTSDDPRRRLGRDDQYAYEPDRRSRLSEQVYDAEREREMRQREQQREDRRECRRIDRVTASYQQQLRQRDMREDEEVPEYLRDYGRGYFPSYGYR